MFMKDDDLKIGFDQISSYIVKICLQMKERIKWYVKERTKQHETITQYYPNAEQIQLHLRRIP